MKVCPLEGTVSERPNPFEALNAPTEFSAKMGYVPQRCFIIPMNKSSIQKTDEL